MLGSPLFRRYWLATSVLVTMLLCAFGALDAWLTLRENLRHLARVQQLEARGAARQIELTLSGVQEQLRAVGQLPWDSGLLTDADRATEFHRLQNIVPSVFELRAVDGDGRERVFVSRVEPDRVGSGIELRGNPLLERSRTDLVFYGQVYFRNVTEPFVTLAVRERQGSSALTLAELDLRFIAALVKGMSVGQSGQAFVVDEQKKLIAHPNLSLTLSKVELSTVDQVMAVTKAQGERPAADPVSVSAINYEGREVLTTAVPISGPPWMLFVEQPRAEAMRPVWDGLYRVGGLLAVGLLASFAISLWLARRLTRPVLSLRDGAERIGRGDLAARLRLDTGDELAAVAQEFNRMAERLQESYAGLEAKVAERTRELAEASRRVGQQASELEALNAALTERLDELGVKKEEADRANVAKTRFLASASHDLRQPMHAISLLVGILGERIGDTELRALVDKVQLSVQAMENLFNSLLDISRLDAGAVTPRIENIVMSNLLQRVETYYGPTARAKGLSLRIVPTRTVVRSDPALLERIAGNLVSNAVRYTEGGRVLVGCRRRGDTTVRLVVIDTGIGIPREHLDDVFDEFFQLGNPERDRSKGLGLGLSIVKRSADLLGHALVVESQPGKGSLFAVELPLVTTESGSPATSPPASAPGGRLDGAFVVVIDDDQESRYAMELLFRQAGCHVLGAGSRLDALTALDGHLRTPDLIVSDYRLRDGETGVDAILQIREQVDEPVPAIVVTGDLSAADWGRMAAAGFELLHKPVNSERLRNAAEALLARVAELR